MGIPDELPLTRQRSALSSYAVASFTCHSVTGTVSKTDEGGRAGGTLLALGVDPRIDRNRGSRSGEDRAEGKASRNGSDCIACIAGCRKSRYLYFSLLFLYQSRPGIAGDRAGSPVRLPTRFYKMNESLPSSCGGAR